MPTPPERLVAGRYALGPRLGRGGMGIVYRGVDQLLQRAVAVKEIVFPPQVPEEERVVLRERALREARTAARLEHHSAVTIFDAVEEDGSVFVVMELVDAPTLEQKVRQQGSLGEEEASRLALDLIDVLQSAHGRGIVHRDVKPGNVMTPPGGTRLADFGIATMQGDPKLTATGLIIGSPQYMSPEQATGGDTGPATDAWGLGATLFFATHGRAPFDRGDAIPTLAAVVRDETPALDQAGRLGPVIAGLLRKEPAERTSLADARRALVPPSATPIPRPAATSDSRLDATTSLRPGGARALPPGKGRGRTAAAVLIGLVVLGGFGAWLAARPDRTAAPDPAARDDRSGDARSVPADWVTYEDRVTGYRLSHPPGWEIRRDGSRTDFVDPETGAYLRVDWIAPPGPDAVAAWEDQSASFGASHDGYEEIRIERARFKGLEGAEWKFVYTEGGARLHALDLGFITEERGYALLFQTREDDWDAMQDIFRAFRSSFEVPS